MIPRYTLEEMGAIWEDVTKKSLWIAVELAVLWAKEKLSQIPKGTYLMACKALGFEPGEEKIRQLPWGIFHRAEELEKISDHDLIALINAVAERLPGEIQPFWHSGLTSYCNEDTGLAIQMVESLDLIIKKAEEFYQVLVNKAKEHKDSIMIGRTHGIHAEPITFALKLLRWADAIDFHLERLRQCKEKIGIGKISGAVGAYTLDPRIEKLACNYLGLKPAKISSQIISRHIQLHYAMTLVAVANTLDMIATNIRTLARTDIGEVKEYKKPGAHGSSAMPGKTHLKNPIKFENISGLAKLVRGYLTPALECEVLWDERSLDNSSAERIYIPAASILLDFMLKRITDNLENLLVYPNIMLENLSKTGGIVFAAKVMNALTDKGMDRRIAYKILEDLALKTEHGTFLTADRKNFKQLVREHQGINSMLSVDELDRCFDPRECLNYIQEIYDRFGI